jgi:RNA polymerase-binding transcription factor DksA
VRSVLEEVDVTAAKKAGARAKKAAPRPTKKAAPKKPAPRAAPAKVTAKKAPSSAKPAGAKKAVPKKALPKKPAPPAKAVGKQRAAPARATKTAKGAATKSAPGKKGAVAKRPASTAPGTKQRTTAKKAAPAGKTAPPRAGADQSATSPVPKAPEVGPYAGDEKFLGEQRDLLLGERSIYEGQAQALRAEADSLALEREPGDVQFDEESGEGGTVTVDRERNLALSVQATLAVEEIDDALRKIERTTYGSCERCHQPIPKARLRALPFARLCVACKSGGLSRR